MSSSFNRVMEEMEKDRTKEKPDVLVERERISGFAQSIADPYLKDLGPKVVNKLKDLGIPAKELVGSSSPFAAIRWWSFEGNGYFEGPYTRLCLLENGTFIPNEPFIQLDSTLYIPSQVRVALRTVESMKEAAGRSILDPEVSVLRSTYPAWSITDDFDGGQVFVDPDSGIVYVAPGDNTFQYSTAPETLRYPNAEPVPELGVYVANYIRYKMMSPR